MIFKNKVFLWLKTHAFFDENNHQNQVFDGFFHQKL